MTCRICYDETAADSLGCACRGSMAYMCNTCLVKSTARRNFDNTCDICGFTFGVHIDKMLKQELHNRTGSFESLVMCVCAQTNADLENVEDLELLLPKIEPGRLRDDAYTTAALAHHDLGNIPRALELVDMVSPGCHKVPKAQCLISAGEVEQAKELLSQVKQETPCEWFGAQNLLLNAMLADGEFDVAVERCRALLPRFNATCGQTHVLTIDTALVLGLALLHLNEFKQAAVTFEKLYRDVPSPILAKNLAVAYLFARDPRAANVAKEADWGKRRAVISDGKASPELALAMLAAGRGEEAVKMMVSLD